VRIFAHINEMCVALSTEFSEICCYNSTTRCCRGAASGKLIFEFIYQIPHIQYLYFRSSGESDNGSRVVTDIDIPMGSLIFISVSSVIRQ